LLELIDTPWGLRKIGRERPRSRDGTEIPCFPFAALELWNRGSKAFDCDIFTIEFLDDDGDEVFDSDEPNGLMFWETAEEAMAMAREVFGVERDEWQCFEPL